MRFCLHASAVVLSHCWQTVKMNADGSGDMEGDLDVNEDDMVEVIELTDEAQPGELNSVI